MAFDRLEYGTLRQAAATYQAMRRKALGTFTELAPYDPRGQGEERWVITDYGAAKEVLRGVRDGLRDLVLFLQEIDAARERWHMQAFNLYAAGHCLQAPLIDFAFAMDQDPHGARQLAIATRADGTLCIEDPVAVLLAAHQARNALTELIRKVCWEEKRAAATAVQGAREATL